MNFLEDLNPYQREAVLTTEGPLLVLAGAGSGKTKVITYRIAHLIQNLNISPQHILAVTFTNKAAEEMKERLSRLLNKPIKNFWVSTFHAFGVRFLREEIHHLGYMSKFSIFGEAEKEDIIKNILLELNLDKEKFPSRLFAYLISQAKNNLEEPHTLKNADATFKQIYELYQKRMKSLNALDFDDLIFLPVLLLKQNPSILEKWSEKFRYLLIDEYQDTNHCQYILAKLLSQKHKNICVVGDDDQSIYAFRGANFHNILEFEKHFSLPDKKVKIITLAINYRSTETILQAAQSVISHNQNRHKKKISSFNNHFLPITLLEALDGREEAEFVASEIFSNKQFEKIPYHHQAVLCRTNTQMKVFEEVFRAKNIPYRLVGGFSFFERKEIKDVLSYLRLIYNPLDNLAFLRTINFPKRGIGEKTLEDLKNFATERKLSLVGAIEVLTAEKNSLFSSAILYKLESFLELITKYQKIFQEEKLSDALKKLIEEVEFIAEYERIYKEEAPFRVKSLKSFLDMAENYEKAKREENEFPSLEDFLSRMLLLNQEEEEEKIENKVTVMTIHASKGLEFDTVYLVGMEEGYLPHEKSIQEGVSAIEEERRLVYVAITRAKRKLYLSYAENRKIYGNEIPRKVSRFLKEIPSHLLENAESGKSEEDYLKELKAMLS